MSTAVQALEAQLAEVVKKRTAAEEARDRHQANAETQQGTVDIYLAEEAELTKAIRAVKADTTATTTRVQEPAT